MNIFHDPIIITISDTDPLISLQTYAPKHGWSQRFYLTKEALDNQLRDNAEGCVTECDLLNVCTVSRCGNSIRFKLFWLHGDDELYGYQQTVFIPVDKAVAALTGQRVKHLSYTPVHREKADIFFTQTAHKLIAKADKLVRHAIRRFFRDHLDYGKDEHLMIQRDEFFRGFYFFSTVSRYAGGIVLHETEVIGKNGKHYPKVYFGIHT